MQVREEPSKVQQALLVVAMTAGFMLLNLPPSWPAQRAAGVGVFSVLMAAILALVARQQRLSLERQKVVAYRGFRRRTFSAPDLSGVEERSDGTVLRFGDEELLVRSTVRDGRAFVNAVTAAARDVQVATAPRFPAEAVREALGIRIGEELRFRLLAQRQKVPVVLWMFSALGLALAGVMVWALLTVIDDPAMGWIALVPLLFSLGYLAPLFLWRWLSKRSAQAELAVDEHSIRLVRGRQVLLAVPWWHVEDIRTDEGAFDLMLVRGAFHVDPDDQNRERFRAAVELVLQAREQGLQPERLGPVPQGAISLAARTDGGDSAAGLSRSARPEE